MKTAKYFTLFLFSFSINQNCFSQQTAACTKVGVYRNFNAFASNTFSDSICLKSKRDKIFVGNNSILKIKSKQDGRKKYKLGDIYGYSDGRDKYRYYFNEKDEYGYLGYFKIVESKKIIIYSQWHLHGGNVYLYSKELDSPIKELTKQNLQKDFENEKFMDEIKTIKDLNKKKENALLVNPLYEKYFTKK